jgi:putative phosphoribosyl transferase
VRSGLRRFRDRAEAGRELAGALREYAGRPDVLVLGLPRGGVPVAYEVARELGAPLDVFVVRKLGVPFQPELAMGAIAGGGVRVLNEEVVAQAGVTEVEMARVEAREREELERRERLYRGGRPELDVEGRTVLLVDDGLATGSTVRAAIEALRRRGPARVVVAVPVAPRDTCAALRAVADEVVCLRTPALFLAVGSWYASFPPTRDEEIGDLLAAAAPGGSPEA